MYSIWAPLLVLTRMIGSRFHEIFVITKNISWNWITVRTCFPASFFFTKFFLNISHHKLKNLYFFLIFTGWNKTYKVVQRDVPTCRGCWVCWCSWCEDWRKRNLLFFIEKNNNTYMYIASYLLQECFI